MKLWRLLLTTISYVRWAWKHNADADWDYDVLLSLMKWKLNKMADNMEKYDIYHTGVDRRVKQLRRMVVLIDRVKDDGMRYYSLHYPHHHDGNLVKTDKGWELRPRTEEQEKVLRDMRRMNKYNYEYMFEYMKRFMPRWWR